MRILNWFVNHFRFNPPAPAPAPTPEPAPPTPVAPGLPGVVDALNVERARYQLAPLGEDARLTSVATTWAREMAGQNWLTHGDFSGRLSAVIPNTTAAEDIAEGATTVAAVVAMWMNSPPHRDNILGPYTIAGSGSASAADGTLYWCVDFDAP